MTVPSRQTQSEGRLSPRLHEDWRETLPGGGTLPQPVLLGLLGLGPVFVHQLEQLGGWRGRGSTQDTDFFGNLQKKNNILDL